MAVPWPVSLQQNVNTGNFNEKFGETAIRTTVDVGPMKVRRRFTRPIDVVSVGFNMTSDQYEDFKIFYNTTVNGGVTIFELNHPITGVLTNYRFMGPPTISPIGGIVFVASMQWEVIP